MILKEIKLNRHLFYLVSLFLISCKSQVPTLTEIGLIQQIEQGFPSVQYGVFIDYSNPYFPKAQLYYEIPYSSLFYKKDDSGQYKAEFEITVWFRSKNNSHLEQKLFKRETIHFKTYSETQSDHVFSISDTVKVLPNEYEMHVELEDVNSRKSVLNKKTFVVEDVNVSTFTVSSIQFNGRQKNKSNRIKPILTYHLGEDFYDLSAQVQLVFKQNRVPAQINAFALKFKSDVLPARFPYQFNQSRASLQYKGIDYSKSDTTWLMYNQYQDELGTVHISIEIPALNYGNYRLVVNGLAKDTSLLVSRARDFAVRSASFPKVESFTELLQTTYYLTSDDEYTLLTKNTNQENQKALFEKFWLQFGENEIGSSLIMKAYYSRVEEANKSYSTYKEGWKTDKGMIFILFGEPEQTEQTIDGDIWIYRNAQDQNGLRFFFRKVRGYVHDDIFDSYILDRNELYNQYVSRMIESWKTGSNLEL